MPEANASSYVAELLKRAIADGSISERRGSTITEHAVLLLADIKGSTGIVERAGSRGRSSLELLTRNLSELYADFVDLIYRYGGDVLFIAGDAFLCYWPTESVERADAEVAAASAALAIQSQLSNRDDGFGQPLQFRIGVATGELSRAFVGGVSDRWELVLSGPLLEAVSAAERDADAGRVLVTDDTYQALGGRFLGQHSPLGWLLDAVEAPDPELGATPRAEVPPGQLAPYLPEAIRKRGDADQQLLAEFRNVTVFMADLPSGDLRDSDVLERLDQCVRDFQSAMQQFEGSIRVDVDSKGLMLLGVFGLPPLAHEDDATRSIRAAETLHAGFKARGLAVSMGIATGRTLCTPLGGDRRREYMVRSEVINRAARLMQASASEIACDAATVSAASRGYEFEALPSHLMKGMAGLVDVLRPVGIRRSSVPVVAQVGRDAEVERLHAALVDLIESGEGSSWWIEGEAGLGKSTLLASLAAAAVDGDARLLRARADSIERTRGLHAWQSVVAELTGVTDSMDSATRSHRLTQAIDGFDRFVGFEPLLASVLGYASSESEQTARMDGDVRAENTRRLVLALVAQAAELAPLVLLVEDGHWLDSQSAQLLREVHSQIPNLLLAATSRPADDPALGAAGSSRGLQTIRLAMLGLTEVEQMLSMRLGVDAVPRSLSELLLEHSGGNPFFIEQIIGALIDDGSVSAASGRCVVNTESIRVPSTLEAVVLSRLDRLPESTQWVAKAASIVGRQVSPAALEAVIDALGVAANLDTDLIALRSAGIFDAASSATGGQDDELQFCHVTSRDVTYGTLPSGLRKQGHAAIASWIERSDTGSLRSDVLSYHWLEAGVLDKALDAAEQAGEMALRLGSFPEALVHFEQAFSLATELGLDLADARAVLWQKGLGTAHYFLGHTDACRESLEQVVGHFDRPVPDGAVRLMLPLLGSVARQLGRRTSAVEQAIPDERKRLLDATVDSYKMLAQVYFLEGSGAAHLLYLPLRGLVVGDAAGGSPALAATLINMSFMTSLMGLGKAAESYAERAKAMTQAGGQLAAAPYVWHINALRLAQRARWDDALASNAEADRFSRELGDYILAPDSSAVLAAITMCRGDLVEAGEAVAIAKDVADARGHELFLCWAILDEALLALARRDLATAEARLSEALAIETPATDLGSVLDKASTTALVRRGQRRFDEARAAAEVVCKTLQDNPPTSYYSAEFLGNAVSVLVDCATANASDGGLRKQCAREIKSLSKLSSTFLNVEPRALLLEGRLARLNDRDGAPAFRKSLLRAEALSMPLDQARALIELGAGSSGEAGAIARAASILTQLGRHEQAAELATAVAA